MGSKVFSIIIRLDDRFSKRIGKAGKILTAGLTVPLVGLGAAAIKSTLTFNESMAKVATLLAKFGTSRAVEMIDELKKGVLDLSTATGKTAKDLSEGLFWVISAFPEQAGNTAKVMEKLKIVNEAAVAGSSSVESSLKLVSSVTKAYGDISNEAALKVANLAFKTNELGVTTFPELAHSIGDVVSLFQQAGLSQEEMFAGFAALTGVTGGTPKVATQLMGILNSFFAQNDQMTEGLKELGYESSLVLLQQKGLVGSIRALDKAFDGDARKMKAALGRVRSLRAALAFLGKTGDAYAWKLKEMGDAEGAMAAAFKMKQEIINKAGTEWKKFKAELVKLKILFGSEMLPAFSKAVGFLSNIVKFISKLSPGTKKVILRFAALLAVIGPLLIALKMFLVLGTALIGMLGGWVLIIGGAVGLGALIVSLVAGLGNLETKMNKVNTATNSVADKQKEYRKQLEETRKKVYELTSQENELNRELTQRMGMDVIKDLQKISTKLKLPSELKEMTGKLRKLEAQRIFLKKEAFEGSGGIDPMTGQPRRAGGSALREYQRVIKNMTNMNTKFLSQDMALRNFLEKLAIQHYGAGTSRSSLIGMGIDKEFVDAIQNSYYKEMVEKMDEVKEEMKILNENTEEGNKDRKDQAEDKKIVGMKGGPVTLLNESLFGRTLPYFTGAY